MATSPVPEIDGFIHEPARLRVLTFLALLERADFMYLLRQTGLSRGNLSVQMSKLEAAGMVQADKQLADGRPRTTYSLTEPGRESLRHYKDTMSRLLASLPD